ncbi:cytochrome P450 [Tricharina praecox]|uniref:cytochrome P450 n=1 Tax=Tricharina praecox TaxID=43433 RepID=UPI00221E45A2|nr:cytochrome P450 [Tricharina praecox]KAI5845535.1 cytochrome P450 [Tricharina praecox]
MTSLLDNVTSNTQYRQTIIIVLASILAVVLHWIDTRVPNEKRREKRREHVFPSVPPGRGGYKKAQARYSRHAGEMIEEGLRKVGESTAFWVPTMIGPTMVTPRKYLAEIKNHPDLSLSEYVMDKFGCQTGFGSVVASRNFLMVVRRITQSLGHVTGAISDEAVLALDEKIPLTDEWSSHKLNPAIRDVVARVSHRILLGDSLCRNERWLDITLIFNKAAISAGMELRRFGHLLAPIVKGWLSSYTSFRKASGDANNLITDIVRERRQQAKEQGDAYVPPNDALQWAMDLGEPDCNLANFQLFLAFVAIHNTSSALIHLIYDLCMYPEYIEMLREEVREVIGDGDFTARSQVMKLKKMDSVLKESQRLHPIQNATMQRKATKDIELSDGFKIYAGEYIQTSTSVLRDPRIYSEPGTFDGLRFYKMRQQIGQQHAHQFASTSEKFFGFGHGKHACPGRFIAAMEIKITLAHLLMRYDFEFPEGQTERPKNIFFEEAIVPNMDQEVLFRRRR